MACDDWDSVQWVVAVAEQHADTLRPTDREDELKHLTDKVTEKVEALGAEAPAALKRLSELLPTTTSDDS